MRALMTLLTLVLVSCKPATAQAPEPLPLHIVAERVADGTVLVDLDRVIGSGFAVDANTIVTAKHVLMMGGMRAPKITTHDGQKCTPVRALAVAWADLAVIQVRGCTLHPLYQHATPHAGMSVLSIGHPHARSWSLATGVVSAVRSERTGVQLDMGVMPGMSGGPLTDRRGVLVGIVLARNEHMGWAAAVRDIERALAEAQAVGVE